MGAEVTRHFDAHRAAGDRVPEFFYRDVGDDWDESIRTTYAWSGWEEDGNLSVGRKNPGDSLCCLSCGLNEHLDEHRTWGLFVAEHAYERLKRGPFG
jgi:hypothetical protein